MITYVSLDYLSLQQWVIPENIHTTPTEEINNTFTIIRNNFSSPPPPDGRNFPRGGVWLFSGTTQGEYGATFLTVFILTHDPANFALWEETGAKYKIQLP